MKRYLGFLFRSLGYGLAATIAYYLSMYAFVAVHEFGHALAMLLVGLSPETIVIGGGELLAYSRFGDTLIAIGSVPTNGATTSGSTVGIVLQTWQIVFVVAAGTIAVSTAFLLTFLWAGVYRVRRSDTTRYMILSVVVAYAPLLGPFWPIALLVVPIDWQLSMFKHLFSPFGYLVFRHPKATNASYASRKLSLPDIIHNYRLNPFMIGTALVFVSSWVQSVGNMLPLGEGSDGLNFSSRIFGFLFGDVVGSIALEGWFFVLFVSLVLFGVSLAIYAMRFAYRVIKTARAHGQN